MKGKSYILLEPYPVIAVGGKRELILLQAGEKLLPSPRQGYHTDNSNLGSEIPTDILEANPKWFKEDDTQRIEVMSCEFVSRDKKSTLIHIGLNYPDPDIAEIDHSIISKALNNEWLYIPECRMELKKWLEEEFTELTSSVIIHKLDMLDPF